MEFKIFSPTSSKSMKVNWLEVQTLQGNFVIQHGHSPMILVLAPNKELSVELEDGSTTLMTISGGILEINRDKATLFLTHE